MIDLPILAWKKTEGKKKKKKKPSPVKQYKQHDLVFIKNRQFETYYDTYTRYGYKQKRFFLII